VRAFLDSFVGETISELFPTREACCEFYSDQENFGRLLNGDIGDNLMYKYRAIASFRIWPEICAVAMHSTRRLVEERGAGASIRDFPIFWADFCRYVQVKHADGISEDEILNPVIVTLDYDVPRWAADGMPTDIGAYRLVEAEAFEFSLSDEGARQLRGALKVWTPTLKGLTKMVTRVRMSWQVRQANRVAVHGVCAVPVGSQSVAAGLLPEAW
jgi:hypothetical protein